MSSDNLELSLRSQSDLDDQHDYDSVASDEDTDQEPLRSTGATRSNRARVRVPPSLPLPCALTQAFTETQFFPLVAQGPEGQAGCS